MSKDFTKRLFEKLQKKSNTPLNVKDIEALASKVDKNSLGNEEKMLGLIRQVSKLANVSLTKEKEDRILKYLKNNNVQNADMKTILSLMSKKLD